MSVRAVRTRSAPITGKAVTRKKDLGSELDHLAERRGPLARDSAGPSAGCRRSGRPR